MEITFTIFAQALAFAGLIWIVATKIWPPMLHAIEERQRRISEGLAAADQGEKALEEAQENASALVKEARNKATKIVDQAHVRAQQIIDEAQQEAKQVSDRMKEQAIAEIEASATKAREGLREEIGTLAIAGAQKILHREIDSSAHKMLLDQLASEI